MTYGTPAVLPAAGTGGPRLRLTYLPPRTGGYLPWSPTYPGSETQPRGAHPRCTEPMQPARKRDEGPGGSPLGSLPKRTRQDSVPVPRGWSCRVAPCGRAYFVDHAGNSQWERPAEGHAAVGPAAAAAAPVQYQPRNAGAAPGWAADAEADRLKSKALFEQMTAGKQSPGGAADGAATFGSQRLVGMAASAAHGAVMAPTAQQAATAATRELGLAEEDRLRQWAVYNAHVHTYQHQQVQLQQQAQQQVQQQAQRDHLSQAVHATAANADAARLWAGAALGSGYKKLTDSAAVPIPPAPPQHHGHSHGHGADDQNHREAQQDPEHGGKQRSPTYTHCLPMPTLVHMFLFF